MQLPEELAKRLKTQLGVEYREFTAACGRPERTAFRVNTLKAGLEVGERFDAEPVPWCPTGFYTGDEVGKSVEHFQGLIYVQEAASMVAAEVLAPDAGEVVLDLASSPGSKTTQLAALMRNTGCIVANDVNVKRLKTLRFNLNRMGAVNAVVVNDDGTRFNPRIRFGRILLDAPCSNTGQLRSNPDSVNTWSMRKVLKCAKLQRGMVDTAAALLKKGGVLVYSTCTFSPEENEAVVDYAVREKGLTIEPVEADMEGRPGLPEWEGVEYVSDVSKTLRAYPHHNDTSGFYVARLRR